MEKHVCGLQGYDPMQDPPCPGCVADPKPSAREARDRGGLAVVLRFSGCIFDTVADERRAADEIDAYANAKLEEAAGLVENMRGGDITTYGQIAAAIRALKETR